jgi:hypothetical protein
VAVIAIGEKRPWRSKRLSVDNPAHPMQRRDATAEFKSEIAATQLNAS